MKTYVKHWRLYDEHADKFHGIPYLNYALKFGLPDDFDMASIEEFNKYREEHIIGSDFYKLDTYPKDFLEYFGHIDGVVFFEESKYYYY